MERDISDEQKQSLFELMKDEVRISATDLEIALSWWARLEADSNYEDGQAFNRLSKAVAQMRALGIKG